MSRPGPKPLASDDEPIDYVGRLVGGKYEVRSKIGDGGMGTVFEAVNRSVGRHVALKVLRPSFARQREALERFEREARAATRIGHPNIIDVLDMGLTEEGLPFLVMEVLEGEELYARLKRTAPFSPSHAIRVLEQVLGALDAAHAAGIVHRDLKPENIFLVERGPNAGLVKILDFGVAKFQDDTELSPRITREGLLVGTPAYMSPEQAVAGGEIDHRSDVYAAGVLLYEMLSGVLPHEGESYMQMAIAIATKEPRPLAKVASWLDADLCAVVDKALSRDPAQRFQTAAALAAALEPFRGDTSVGNATAGDRMRRASSGLRRKGSVPPRPGSVPGMPAPQVTLAEEPLPEVLDAATPRRVGRPWVLPLAAAVVLLGGGVGLFALSRGEPEERARPAARRRSPAATPTAATPAKAPAPAEPAAPPAPPPAAPSTVTLDVVANVRHARVRLDGVLIGETPLHEIVARSEGEHALSVEATGYARADARVVLDRDRRVELDLERLPRAETPPPARHEVPERHLPFEQDPYARRAPAPPRAP